MARDLEFRGLSWTPNDMPDLSGKVVIVTGGAVGCGWEMVRRLLQKRARVVIATRSPQKAGEGISKLRNLLGQDIPVHFIPLDLGKISTVRPFVDSFNAKFQRLDILINNAGVMTPPKGSVTEDGDELQFGTNVLGHFALTAALFPVLRDSATATKAGTTRVVWVTSDAYAMAPKPPIQYDDLHMSHLSPGFRNDFVRYGQSKAGNILLCLFFQRHWARHNIISTTSHPGYIRTELQRHRTGLLMSLMRSVVMKPPEYGCINALYAGTALEIKGGEYIVPWGKQGTLRDDMTDENEQNRLWEYCSNLVKQRGLSFDAGISL